MSSESSAGEAPVLLEHDGAVRWLRFNRPGVLNALDEGCALALRDALRRVAEDEGARVLVLAGRGRGFMAGGDLGRFRAEADRAADVADAIITPFHEALSVMDALSIPVLASVHGPVAGAGMSVAMAADLCVAADDARFTFAYTRIGTTPDGSGSFNLPRLVGMRKAMEIALLGDSLDAAQALGCGLVNRVVPAASLEAETKAVAERLAAGPPLALARTKALLRESPVSTLEQQLAAEQACFRASAATGDFREGITAFFEKRPATFRGR